MSYIFENGTQLDITKDQADELVNRDLIYHCDEDGHDCYHITNELLGRFDNDADKAFTYIKKVLIKPIGWQIADEMGLNCQGDDGVDKYTSYEILDLPTATDYLAELNEGRPAQKRYLLMPIYEDDIEEPTFITWGAN